MSRVGAFEPARFEAERAALGVSWGAPQKWLETTESTNDDALAAAKAGAAHGALFGAETQTRGRGRRGNPWLSTPGEGLWFSLVLRPSFAPELAAGVPLCAGLAVRSAAARLLSASVKVKWPNDVWVERRKLAGVLVESQISGARLASVVLGIGVNVTQREFPSELGDIATSLALSAATELGRERFLANVLCELEARWALLEAGKLAELARELGEHDALFGQRVRVEQRSGIARGVDARGQLLLEDAQGKLQACLSGHVELLG